MLIVLLSDLYSDENMATVWKVVWLPVLVCLPLLGGLLYGSVSLIRSLAGLRQRS